MGRALGSTAAHERMNSLMAQMMGSTATDRMHAYLGERYLGQNAQIPNRYMPMYGLIGMMTGYRWPLWDGCQDEAARVFLRCSYSSTEICPSARRRSRIDNGSSPGP